MNCNFRVNKFGTYMMSYMGGTTNRGETSGQEVGKVKAIGFTKTFVTQTVNPLYH